MGRAPQYRSQRWNASEIEGIEDVILFGNVTCYHEYPEVKEEDTTPAEYFANQEVPMEYLIRRDR
jgi:hypothetical protein